MPKIGYVLVVCSLPLQAFTALYLQATPWLFQRLLHYNCALLGMQAKQGQGDAEQHLHNSKSGHAEPMTGQAAADHQAEGDALAQMASPAAEAVTPAPMLVDSQEPLTGLSSGMTVG